jgi:hypothetical protein
VNRQGVHPPDQHSGPEQGQRPPPPSPGGGRDRSCEIDAAADSDCLTECARVRIKRGRAPTVQFTGRGHEHRSVDALAVKLLRSLAGGLRHHHISIYFHVSHCSPPIDRTTSVTGGVPSGRGDPVDRRPARVSPRPWDDVSGGTQFDCGIRVNQRPRCVLSWDWLSGNSQQCRSRRV